MDLTERELCEIKPEDDLRNIDLSFKIPRSFDKDKEYCIGEFVKMGVLSRVKGHRHLVSLSKRFRKENPKLINSYFYCDTSGREADYESVRNDGLCKLLLCEEDDLPNLLQGTDGN